MYCTECGIKSIENSKYCPNCGTKSVEISTVKEGIAEQITEGVVNHVSEIRKSTINYEFLRKCSGWYLAWVLIHLAILLIWSRSISGDEYYSNDFWPFDSWKKLKVYDFREFLVYSIFPFAIILIISLLHNSKEKSKF